MSKKILLIEDNLEIRENTAEILQLAGYTVTAAENGREGIAAVHEEMPDLILCDIMMPVLDGFGVLHLLGKNEKTAGIPFIFLTAKSERTDMRKGMEMGADDYLTKPFDDIELLNAIESRLRKTDILRKEFSKDVEGINSFLSDAKSIADLKKLSLEKETGYYRKKDEVYREGGYPKGVFFLNKGKVKTGKTADNGKELTTSLYNEGDFFGYHALLEEGRYTDTATVMEEAEIYLLPKDDFFDLLYRNVEVARKFIKILSNDLGEKEEQLVKLAYNSVRKKVADALLQLQKRFSDDTQTNFSMQVSREDLANLAGTATESTIRTLSDFKDEGLIDIKGSKITILALEKLAGLRN